MIFKMVEKDTYLLTGFELEWVMNYLEDYESRYSPGDFINYQHWQIMERNFGIPHKVYTNWTEVGSIIERLNYSVEYTDGLWVASRKEFCTHLGYGNTPIEAVLRLYIILRHGLRCIVPNEEYIK